MCRCMCLHCIECLIGFSDLGVDNGNICEIIDDQTKPLMNEQMEIMSGYGSLCPNNCVAIVEWLSTKAWNMYNCWILIFITNTITWTPCNFNHYYYWSIELNSIIFPTPFLQLIKVHAFLKKKNIHIIVWVNIKSLLNYSITSFLYLYMNRMTNSRKNSHFFPTPNEHKFQTRKIITYIANRWLH